MQSVTSPQNIASFIDHTLLKPTLYKTDLEKLCKEAAQYSFKTVCVPPTWVTTCVELLKGTSVGTITVVGFPLGYQDPRSKALESAIAIDQGASEIDMVINLSFLKSGMEKELAEDIQTVVKACRQTPLKVIIETGYLTQAEKILAAKISEDAGATFVKTSTGFATGVTNVGATLADIELLRQTLRPETKIKASGGIKDLAQALSLIRAGADRLGTSAGVALMSGLKTSGEY